MSRLRELKIITFVGCPECGRPAGQPCLFGPTGRLRVHASRKSAWQADQRRHDPDMRLTPHFEGPVGGRTSFTLIAPQNARALAWLRREADPSWDWIGGALRVPVQAMPGFNRRLIFARWRTTGME